MSAVSRSVVRHSDSLALVWRLGEVEGQHMGEEHLSVPHFFLGLLKFSDLDYEKFLSREVALREELMLECRVQSERLLKVFNEGSLKPRYCRRRLREIYRVGLPKPVTIKTQHLRRDKAARLVFASAEEFAGRQGGIVYPIHLLAALLDANDPLCLSALESQKVDVTNLVKFTAKEMDDPAWAKVQLPTLKPSAKIGTAEAKWGRDLTRLAAENRLEPVIGRAKEIRALAQCLVQKQKNSVILIGDPGVGKTVLVEALAQKLAGPDAPPGLKDIRLVELNISSLLAGTSHRGDFEERLNRLITEAEADPNLVYFIDELHTIVGAGRVSGAMDAANQLKPAIARGSMRVIGATTTAEYRKWIESDHALQRRFHIIWVEEPSRAEALEIVRGVATRLQEHHNLIIREEAIVAAIDLSIRHLPEFRLPDKAIDLIDQACAQSRFRTLAPLPVASRGLEIGAEEIKEVVSQRCKIPVQTLNQDEESHLLRLEEALGRRVKGQDEAIHCVADALRLAKAGLRQANRPLAVFLFAGPSGTGKTELAKAITEQMFGQESAMIRLDMSEFMEAHSISKLIGAPPGFVGYDSGGRLTDKIIDNPYALVLFDEIDKAHPRVLDLLLQLLDEASLTDASGRKASVANAIIVLTMNVPTGKQGRRIGFGENAGAPQDARKEFEQNVVNGVKAQLRPELVNRLGHIVPFHELGQEDLRKIVEKILARLNQQLQPRQVEVSLAAKTYELIIARGFNPQYGARGMERTFEELIAQPLARKLLERNVTSGRILATAADNGAIEFTSA